MQQENAWFLDLKRAYNYSKGSRVTRIITCLRAPGVQAVTTYRFGRWLKKRNLTIRILGEPLFFLVNGSIKALWGIELPRNATIGPGLYIGHFGGITISADAVIGRNCNISQGITIGFSGNGVPTIGDNVYIAPGAKVFGKINIGSNVKIGANAVVHRDVPDSANVVLNPGFIILSYKGNPNPNQV
jgi:serine O-acetyltransferase